MPGPHRARWLVLVLVFVVRTPAAHARGLVRAAANGPGIAMAFRGGPLGWTVWHAPDGSSFAPVAIDVDRWILDLVVADDGALLIASGPVPREGPITLSRIHGTQRSDMVVAGSRAISGVVMVAHGRRVALLDAGGAFLSNDGGRAFNRAATWAEGYGMYAATATMSMSGTIDVLVPDFETCSSADLLIAVHHHRVGSGAPAVRVPDEAGDYAPVLGPEGLVFVARERGSDRACELIAARRGGSRVLMTLPAGTGCWMRGRADRGRTVVVVDRRLVLELDGSRARALTRLAVDASDVYPTSWGALVLTGDDRLLRVSRGAPPREIWARPPPRQPPAATTSHKATTPQKPE